MKLEAIRNALTSRLGRKLLVAQKHSPQIMFAAGVVGVVATAVLASRATLKLDKVLDEHETVKFNIGDNKGRPGYSEHDAQRDMVVLHTKTALGVVKLYAPAIIVGAATIGLLTGAHVVMTKRNIALTAAYAALERGYREYRDRVIGELGEEKDAEFRFGTVEQKVEVESKDGSKKIKTVTTLDPSGYSVYARYFDESCPSWSKDPEYNRLFLQCQQNYANEMLKARGHVFLNEIYDMLGMERSGQGAVVGWVLGHGDDFVDFGIFNENHERARMFVNGLERSIRLDFNVAGLIYDKIGNGRKHG